MLARGRFNFYELYDEERFKVLKTIVDLLERSNGKYRLTTKLIRAELGFYIPVDKIREVLNALVEAKVLLKKHPRLVSSP